jgi:hypothetical protein
MRNIVLSIFLWPTSNLILIFVFLEEMPLWQGNSLSQTTVVAYTATTFTGKHGFGVCLVLLELHMFVDGEGIGIIGTFF